MCKGPEAPGRSVAFAQGGEATVTGAQSKRGRGGRKVTKGTTKEHEDWRGLGIVFEVL